MITGEKIYVVSVQRQSVQGRHNYSFDLTSGTSVPANRSKAKGIKIPLSFPKETATNTLITGMDEQVENPYYKQDLETLPVEKKPGSHWVERYDKISSQQTISLQTLLEILDNEPEGTYNAKSGAPLMQNYLDTKAITDSSPTLLDNFRIYLHEGVNVFSGDTKRGRLGILVCKKNPKVAPSKDEINPDYHEFYIGEAEEQIKEQNKKIDWVMEGLNKLGTLLKDYDKFTAYQIATILDLVKGDVTDNTVEAELKQYIWEQKRTKQGKQEERIQNFSALFDELTKDRDRIYIKYLIKQAVNTLVFTTSGGYYFWSSKKQYDNLYKHTDVKKLETMFYNELERYDPDIEGDNWFKALEDELKTKKVRCR